MSEIARVEPVFPPLAPPPAPGGSRSKARGPVLARLAVVVGALAKLKPLVTLMSVAVSIAAYALFWGLPFAVGFVALLAVHEMGHVWQLRREGVAAGPPLFIPFLGAVIAARSLGRDAAAEARVGIAGPIAGTAATAVPALLWLATGDDLFRALTFTGLVLNLFNLLPVLPLDGGRVMAAMSPWIWPISLAGLAVMAVMTMSPVIGLVLLLGGVETWRRFRDRGTPAGRAYLAVPAATRIALASTYLLLAGGLLAGAWLSYLPQSL